MNTNNIPTACNNLIPLQLLASQYGYAALLDADGNEMPITELMIQNACEEARDALYSFPPQHGKIPPSQP